MSAAVQMFNIQQGSGDMSSQDAGANILAGVPNDQNAGASVVVTLLAFFIAYNFAKFMFSG